MSFGFINSILFCFFYFLCLFKCISGLSLFAVSGDVFYTLSFYLRTLRTMSRFGWGERVVLQILQKKKKRKNNDSIDDNKTWISLVS